VATRAGVMRPHIFAGVDCICLTLFRLTKSLQYSC
jgi:hypothetical protein